MISVCAVSSCQNLSDVWYAIDDIDERLTTVEEQVENMNTNIAALQKVCDALENRVSISRVVSFQDGYGYQIFFSNGETAVIKDGVDGKDGSDGKDGKDGADGKDGKDGRTPSISVAYDPVGGFYYWTLDGEPLLDASGSKVRANGADALAPIIALGSTLGERYVKDATYISVDGGQTWTRISGEGGVSFFRSVTVDEATGKVKMVLADGTSVELPYVKDFMFAFEKSEVYLAYGSEADVKVTYSGVSAYQIVKPDGWKASLKDSVLYVKSPSVNNTFADTEGEIAVIAVSKSGFTTISKLNVGIQEGGMDVRTVTASRSVTLECVPNKSVSRYEVYEKVFTEDEAASVGDDAIASALEDVTFQSYSGGRSVTLDVPATFDAGSKAVVFILLYNQKDKLAEVKRIGFTVEVGKVGLEISGEPALNSATLVISPDSSTEYYFLWVGKKSVLDSFKINEKDPAPLIEFLCQAGAVGGDTPKPVWLNYSGERTFDGLEADTDYTVVCVPVKTESSKEPSGYLSLLEFRTMSKSAIPPTFTADLVAEESDWLYTSVKYSFGTGSSTLYAMVTTQDEWDAYLKDHSGEDNRGYVTANAVKYACDASERTIRFDTHASTPVCIISMTENLAGVKSEIVTIRHMTPEFEKGDASCGPSVAEKTDSSVLVCANVDEMTAYCLLYCATEKEFEQISGSAELIREFVCRKGVKVVVQDGAKQLSYTFSGLSENTKYHIMAIAVDGSGKCEEYAHITDFFTDKKNS